MKNVYQLLYSRNSTEHVKVNLSFVIFKRISRHFRGIKIKIFRGSSPPDPPSWLTLTRPPLAPPPSRKLAARALTKATKPIEIESEPCLRNRKHVPCFYRVIETRLEVWETGSCSHIFFEFSQTFTSVSITR